MILVSWNVAGRKSRLREQAERVLETAPDLVCLQEVTPVTAAGWTEALSEAGLQVAVGPPCRGRGREAGRWPCSPRRASRSRPLPWMTCRGRSGCLPYGPALLEIVNVHSPVSPKPELAKVRTHEAVFRHLSRWRLDRASCSATSTHRAASTPTARCGLRAQPQRPASRGPRRTLGRGRVRPRPRPRITRLPRRVPRAERLRLEGAELGMAPHGRRLPPGPPDRIRRRRRDRLLLPPRLAPRRPALRPLGAGRGALRPRLPRAASVRPHSAVAEPAEPRLQAPVLRRGVEARIL